MRLRLREVKLYPEGHTASKLDGLDLCTVLTVFFNGGLDGTIASKSLSPRLLGLTSQPQQLGLDPAQGSSVLPLPLQGISG